MNRTSRGFTLVELIIVIAVIGILAAILIPVFANVIDKANDKSALSDARNVVSQYMIDAAENSDLPQNIVIMVKKAGNYYLYGFNTAVSSELQISGNNPYEDLDTLQDLVDNWSFNAKHPGEVPESGKTDYDADADGTFYLVPYTGGVADVDIKGFHGNKADGDGYLFLSDDLSENMGDDVEIAHGILLGGTYELDGSSGGSGGSGGATPVTKYTVTFTKGSLDGDSKARVPSPITVNEGSVLIPSSYSATYSYDPNTDAEWYVFDGWDQTGSIVVNNDITLAAQWSKVVATKYTLNFDADGGSLNLASGVSNGMQVLSGRDVTSYIKGSTATKDGYTFGGWTDGAVVYNSSYSGTIIMNGDMNLKAVWTESKYTVTIDNGNGDATYKLGEYAQGEQVTLPVAPTNGDKVFDYWKTSNTDDTTQYGATGTYTMPGEDVTITAVWKSKFDVEFYDYTGSKESSQRVNAGDKITLPTTSSVEKPDTDTIDYRFTGWSCDLGGTYAPGEEYTVTADVVFTAIWQDVPKFTVSFTAGILQGNANVSGIPASFTATPTTVVNPYEYSTPVYNYPGSGSDYTFDGWEPASVTMAEETVTFVAQWVEIPYYTVTFEANGGTLNLAALEGWTNGGALRGGTDITSLVTGSTASKTEANFLGWKSSITGVTYDSSASTIPFTGNVTFTAQFSDKTYTLSFDAGTGTGSYEITGKKLNDKVTMPTAATAGVSKDGYVLSGWKHSSGIEYSAGAEYTVDGNATFTAQWTKNTFTVEYVQGSPAGATLPSPATEEYDVGTATVTLKASTFAWYYMNGYTTTLGGAGVAAGATINTSGVIAGTTITVTPTWVAKTLNVTYTNGGYDGATGLPAGETLTLKDDRTVTVSTTEPTLSGYNFTGWFAMFNGDTVTEGSSGEVGKYLGGDDFTVSSEPAEKTSTLQFLACFEEAQVQEKTITVSLYDTWNENNAGSVTVTVGGSDTVVTKAAIDTAAAAAGVQYWVTAGDAAISGTSATANGSRLATTSSADTAYNTDGSRITYTTYTGSGNRYQGITTYTGLQKINGASYLSGRYVLLNNITNISTLYEPIGWLSSGDTSFTGVFDGNNYALSLYMYYDNGTNVGLVALNSGIIKNVVFNCTKGGSITGAQVGASSKVGPIAGVNETDGKIYNCYVYTTVQYAIIGVESVGGIAGYNDGLIEYCRVNTSKTGNIYGNFTGGITGENAGTVTKCSVFADPNCWNDSTGEAVGGLVGINAGTVSECVVTGRVNYALSYTSGYGIGGLIGEHIGGYLDNCYYNNFVSGQYYVCGYNAVGGLVGHMENSASTAYVRYCYVYTGGVEYSYNGYLGIGYRYSGTVTQSFACGTSSSYNGVTGVTSWTTFKNQATSWDWTNIWSDAATPYTLRRARVNNA